MDNNNFTGELMSFPDELLGEITQRCGALELVLLGYTCHRFRKIITFRVIPFMNVVDKLRLWYLREEDSMYSRAIASVSLCEDEVGSLIPAQEVNLSEDLIPQLEEDSDNTVLYDQAEDLFQKTMMARFQDYIPDENHIESVNCGGVFLCPTEWSPYEKWCAFHFDKQHYLHECDKSDLTSLIETDIKRGSRFFVRNLEWNYIFDTVDANSHPDRNSCHEFLEKQDDRFHNLVFRICSQSQQMFKKFAKRLKLKEEDVVKYNGKLCLLAFSYKYPDADNEIIIWDDIIIPLHGKMIWISFNGVGKAQIVETANFQTFEEHLRNDVNQIMGTTKFVQTHL